MFDERLTLRNSLRVRIVLVGMNGRVELLWGEVYSEINEAEEAWGHEKLTRENHNVRNSFCCPVFGFIQRVLRDPEFRRSVSRDCSPLLGRFY